MDEHYIPRSQWICSFPQKALDRPRPVQMLPYGDGGCPLCGAHLAGMGTVWHCCRKRRCERCGQALDWTAYEAHYAARGEVWANPDPEYARAAGLWPLLQQDTAPPEPKAMPM